MLHYVIFAILISLTNAEQNFEIEDIPIEHFVHDDAENDAFDVELMPRSSRSLFPELNVEDNPFLLDTTKNIGVRRVRQVDQSDFVTSSSKEKKQLVQTLGQPLEISVIEAENTTQKSTKPDTVPLNIDVRDEVNFLINDFIRFRRASEQDNLNGDGSSEEKVFKKQSR